MTPFNLSRIMHNNNSLDPRHIFSKINQDLVGNVVIDGLHGVLPHTQTSNIAEMIMAHVVMLKASLMSLPNVNIDSSSTKELIDYCWNNVLVEDMAHTHVVGRVH